MKRGSNLFLTVALGWAWLGATSLPGASPLAAVEDPKPAKPAIYDEKADAAADLSHALARAKAKNHRVLVQWGANWCGWCAKLHELFTGDEAVRKALLYEYDVVHVDVGKFDKNLELAQRYGADLKAHGLPYLTVLDAEGQVLANQDTGELEAGPVHDPKKVLAFLAAHQAKPLEAAPLLDAALARAKADGKRVFVHFGAPWCGWCRQLEAWTASADAHALLEKEFVELEIDIERMVGGADLMARYRSAASGGIPWFAFLDAQGRLLAGSDAAAGNVGFPQAEEELAHFGAMLKTSAQKLAPADIDALLASLRAWREAREAARKAKAG